MLADQRRGAPRARGFGSLPRALSLLACVAASGCGPSNPPIPQQVVGKVILIGEPPGERKVKLLTRDQSGCAGVGVEATTDQTGAFKFSRILAQGALTDEMQQDRLCLETAGGWVPVWEHSYSPAPVTLDIFCAGTVDAWKCEVFGDGVSYASPPQ